MSAPAAALPGLPRRERVLVVAGLLGATGLAWAYLASLAAGMAGMTEPMAGGGAATGARLAAWTAADWVLTLVMWAVMMVGMMLPSALPTILLFAAVRRHQQARGHVIAPVPAYVAGYLLAWTAFCLGATALQAGLERLALLTPAVAVRSAAAGGLLLVAAGLYQLSPLKSRCLEHCRSPVEFLARRWRRGLAGAVRMGVEHGAYCVGCCWALMALLFVGGVMNLLWVAVIAAFVLAEKVLPHGHLIRRGAAALLIGWGLVELL